jgi:hypothetical protein
MQCWCLDYLKKVSQTWVSSEEVFYKLSLCVSQLPEKDIANVVVQCRYTISYQCVCLNYLKDISNVGSPV